MKAPTEFCNTFVCVFVCVYVLNNGNKAGKWVLLSHTWGLWNAEKVCLWTLIMHSRMCELIPRHSVSYSAPLCTLFRATLYLIPRHSLSYSAPLCILFRATLYLIPRHSVPYSAPLCTLFHATLYLIPRHSVTCSAPVCTQMSVVKNSVFAYTACLCYKTVPLFPSTIPINSSVQFHSSWCGECPNYFSLK